MEKAYETCLEAVKACDPQGLTRLIADGADVNKQDDSGVSALGWAALLGEVECLGLLLAARCSVDGFDAACKSKMNHTAAMRAAFKGSEACLQKLVDYGCDVNKNCMSGKTALMYAASAGHEGCVEILLKAGSHLDERSNNGWTPLIFAAEAGREGCVASLVKAGADVDAGAESGYTAAIYAAFYGHEECLAALIEAGCDIQAKSAMGSDAYKHASNEGNEGCMAMLMAESERRALLACVEDGKAKGMPVRV